MLNQVSFGSGTRVVGWLPDATKIVAYHSLESDQGHTIQAHKNITKTRENSKSMSHQLLSFLSHTKENPHKLATSAHQPLKRSSTHSTPGKQDKSHHTNDS